ncbi:alpha/beta fold hydrolase [Streptomyces sp. NPDC047813]|uniref:alpha/beta hydrolase n=1 Tax=Streptomyces sp. NPDC047813 TaxID=3154608 RepID=UPI0033EC68FD
MSGRGLPASPSARAGAGPRTGPVACRSDRAPGDLYRGPHGNSFTSTRTSQRYRAHDRGRRPGAARRATGRRPATGRVPRVRHPRGRTAVRAPAGHRGPDRRGRGARRRARRRAWLCALVRHGRRGRPAHRPPCLTDRMVSFSAGLARRCRTHAGDLVPYASTCNSARDMDVIRAALGERRISYLGYSYGSYLGEVYTTMFPGRTDRVVLDGVIDPARYGPRLLRGTEAAGKHALRGWADWTAAHDEDYGLGRTGDAVLATVEEIQSAAERAPLRVGAYRVDDQVLPALVLNGLSQDNPSAYGDFAQGVRELRRAAGGDPVSPSPWLAELLQFLLTGHDSAYGSAQTAILCGDGTAPRDPETYWRDLRRADPRDRFFAPVTNDINACAFWGPPRERPTTLRADLPALLVNATGDPRTLYSGAETVHRGWPSSRLITLHDADQHVVFGVFGSACVDDAVNAYLASGRLPATDVSCPRTRS